MLATCAFLTALAGTSPPATATSAHADVIRKVSPAVVELIAASSYDQFLGSVVKTLRDEDIAVTVPEPQRREQHLETASGIVFDRFGSIVTTASFAVEADEFRAVLSDGTETTAVLLGIDMVTDIAVLRLNGPTPKPATFSTDSRDYTVGGELCIVGAQPATGCVLGDGRLHSVQLNRGIDRLHDYLLLDTPYKRGSSGAAVVSRTGVVLGMVSARDASGGTLAIPAPTVQKVASDLIQHGTVRRAWLGVTCEERPGAASRPGAHVFGIEPESPAMVAGIRPGDVIVSFDRRPVQNVAELHRIVFESEPGASSTITVQRGEEQVTLVASLGERRAMARPGRVTVRIYETFLGVWTRPARTTDQPSETGLLVRRVLNDSPAELAGIRAGDLLLTVNGRPLTDSVDLRRITSEYRPGTELELTLRRESEEITVRAELAGRMRDVVLISPNAYFSTDELTTRGEGPELLGTPTNPAQRSILRTFSGR